MLASRVFIRPPNPGDCDAFVEAIRRSRPLHRGWITPRAKTREGFKKLLKRFVTGENVGFIVIHRETNEIVGAINLNNISRGSFQSTMVGYYAFLPHAGKGLMREGMMLVLRHAFKKLKLHRVEANIQPDNHASLALVKRCGFVREGLGRRLAKVCGRWKDHERWAILAEDF